MTDAALVVLGALGIVTGLVGVVLPVVPGLLLVWVATAGTLLASSRSPLVVGTVVVLTALAIAGTVASAVLPARRTIADGAPPSSLGIALAAGVVGFFVIPVVGLVLGAAVGLLLAERSRLGDWAPAWRSTRRMAAAYGLGVALELVAGVVMALLWVGAWLLM